MKIKRFNESVREKMIGKSRNEVEKALFKLTPYGMLDRIYSGEDLEIMGDMDEFEEMARERVDESVDELDRIFEKYENRDLGKLINDVADWVKKNGGNEQNVLGCGFKPLSEHIVSYGIQDRHDSIVIYDDDVFDKFKELLKTFCLCEVHSNNKDYRY